MELRRLTLIYVVGALLTVAGQGMADAAMVVISQAPRPSVPDGNPDPPGPGEDAYTSFTFLVDLDQAAGEGVINMAMTFTVPNNNMFQIHPVIGGIPRQTSFNDLNTHPNWPAGFTGGDDSQFDFSGSPGFDWDVVLSLPSDDTSSRLATVAFNQSVAMGGSGPRTADFSAHVVIPSTSWGTYAIDITYADSSTDNFSDTFGVVPIPEASQVLAGIVLTTSVLGVCIVRRRLLNHSPPA
jgi:hypothetical protein